MRSRRNVADGEGRKCINTAVNQPQIIDFDHLLTGLSSVEMSCEHGRKFWGAENAKGDNLPMVTKADRLDSMSNEANERKNPDGERFS